MSIPAISGMICILGLCLASGMPSVATAQTKQFHGWVVGCDNVKVCTAIAFAEPSKAVAEPGIPFIQIRHHPHRDATPEIRLLDPGAASGIVALAKQEARLVATPTGAEVAKGPTTYPSEYDGKGGFRFRSKDARSILAALRAGETITVSIGSKRHLRLLTPGLDAALGYMDDQQDLADTPGALVRKPGGTLNDYLHPTPPDLETVEGAAFGETAHSDIRQSALPPVPRCKPATPDVPIEAYPLKGRTVLLRRDCGVDGGNAMSAWYLNAGANGRPTLLEWRNTDGGRRAGGALLANAEVLPNGGLIRAIRYRAPTQDCGVSERWAWTKAGVFVLAERREMPLCRTAGPDHWIITYRANLVSPD